VSGRWPLAAAGTAALAAGCTVVAVLLPAFPDFASTFPNLDPLTIRRSTGAFSERFGVAGTWCLLGIWVQGIAASARREVSTSRVVAAARGALFAALLLSLAGAVPGLRVNERLWPVMLGILLGLVEAKARARRTA